MTRLTLTDTKPYNIKSPSQDKCLNNTETVENTPLTIGDYDKILEIDDMEILPTLLTFEVTLMVEEIPPLDIFYSTQYEYFIKRQ